MSAISRIAVAVLFFTTLFTLACGGGGGSDSGTFPPVFVVPNPGSASEGAPFTYTLQANDPQGGAVTFALVSGPTGATLSGATINWTPTHAQSRQPNTFTVKAMSRSGASATTSFSVTPAGTIRGSDVVTYWSASGAVNSPVSLSSYMVQALVSDDAGGITSIAGQGASDGTFTIPNVPAGDYWLQLTPPQPVGSPTAMLSTQTLYRTDASDIDVGGDVMGRPNMSWVQSELTVTANLDLSGLDPWPWFSADPSVIFNFTSSPGGLTGVSVNAGSQFGFTLPEVSDGATSIVAQQVPTRISRPIDPSQGDTTYLLQYKHYYKLDSGTDPLSLTDSSSLSKAMGPLSLTVDSNTTSIDFSGTFDAPNQGSFTAKVKAAGFINSVSGTNPNAKPNLGFTAEARYMPVMDRYARPSPAGALSSMYAASGVRLASVDVWRGLTADVDFGTLTYSNPFPATASPVYVAQQGASVPVATVSSGNTTVSISGLGLTGYFTTTPPSADKPIDAPMLNVQNPQINGASLFQASSFTTPVTLSWSAPVGVIPSGYVVTIEGWDPNVCMPIVLPVGATPVCLPSTVSVSTLTTAGSSILIPNTLFTSGLKYTFAIRALSDAATSFRTAPNRGSWNRAYSDVVSSLIPFGNSTSGAIQSAARPVSPGANNEVYLVGEDGKPVKLCTEYAYAHLTPCSQ